MARMRQTLWISVTVLATLTTLGTTAEARIKYRNLEDRKRDYTQRGLQIYAGFGRQGYTIEDRDYAALEDFDDERLFFIGAAIGLDRRVALYFEGAGSNHGTPSGEIAFGYAHIGIKYAPKTGHRHLWQPYGKASVGGTFLWEDNDRHLNRRHHDDDSGYFGPSIGFGLGIDRFIGRRTALFAEVGMIVSEIDTRMINGEHHDLVDDFGVTSGRFLFGLRFRL